jgi:hypothetical protein
MVSATIGLCYANGQSPSGQACTFQPGGCVPRAENIACVAGNACFGQTGQAAGTCKPVCTPNSSLTTCPAGTTCTALSGGYTGVCQ